MDANALIVWRGEDGRLRLAETSVTDCRRLINSPVWDVGICTFPAEVLDVTAENAAERVRTLAQPLIGKRVSWKHGKGRRSGVVVGIYDNLGEAEIRYATGTSVGLPFDRLTVEEG